MTKFEQGMLITITVCVIAAAYLGTRTVSLIEDAGGFKQIVIDAGKEIKDIGKKINED